MKILIDLQGLQRHGNRKRGIGRYSLEITKSLIYNYPENEYILFANVVGHLSHIIILCWNF